MATELLADVEMKIRFANGGVEISGMPPNKIALWGLLNYARNRAAAECMIRHEPTASGQLELDLDVEIVIRTSRGVPAVTGIDGRDWVTVEGLLQGAFKAADQVPAQARPAGGPGLVFPAGMPFSMPARNRGPFRPPGR